MKAKAIVAGLIALLVLLFVALALLIPRRSRPEITLRHVKSTRFEGVTTMSFEVSNYTADPYIFSPFEVQVRNGTGWSKFQGFDITKIHPIPKVAPKGVASYTVDVTNLPVGSVVRLSIRPQKILLGVNGFVRRAELKLRRPSDLMSLNPYDRNYSSSQVFGRPTGIVLTKEWVETGN